MEGAAINFVRLEEQLNRLLYDPEIQKLRGALPDGGTAPAASGTERRGAAAWAA